MSGKAGIRALDRVGEIVELAAEGEGGKLAAKAILLTAAHGLDPEEVAAELGCPVADVRRALRVNEVPLRHLCDAAQRAAHMIGLPRLPDAINSILDTACDSSSRCQPQAMRVLGEYLGIIGKAAVHIGDVNVGEVNVGAVDARSINVGELTEDERRQLERLRDLMGA